MDISNKSIDGGKAFDWGKTSADYAKFRDIYPREFYEKIALWEREYMKLLEKIAPPEFDVLHYAAMAQLTKK